MKIRYMWKSECVADIEYDLRSGFVKVTNYSDDLIRRPFGRNENPSSADMERFLESRCFPKNRDNCKQLLELLGMDSIGYNPLAIVRKTHGRQHEDYAWLLFEGEDLDYERDIKLRP